MRTGILTAVLVKVWNCVMGRVVLNVSQWFIFTIKQSKLQKT